MPDTEKDPSPDSTSDTAIGSDDTNGSEKKSSGPGPRSLREDGKIECTEEDNYEHTGYMFPKWKNVYPNVVDPLTVRFRISGQAARTGQMIFLVCYAFGCELWAPWSEEFGRWKILQLSLFLVNIWQIPCALAPNFGTIVVCRGLGGLSSAGGSVTLGLVADLFEADHQQYGVAFIVLSSVGGTSIGPVVGAFIQRYLDWSWNFWIQLILGVAVQAAHFFLVPETRSTIMMDKLAKKRRKAGETNIWGPNELKAKRITMKDLGTIWSRPFIMFVSEPIVLCLFLLSGFSDALIFTFLESFTPVYKQWGFGVIAVGLSFIPINIGYIISWLSFFPFIRRHNAIRRRDPNALQPEARLYWLLYLAPLETIGLFGFAWASLGPGRGVHWIAPMIFSVLIAIANYAIYMATIDYMVASYGPYAASATGGNGFARDSLAGIAAMYSTPFYEKVGTAYHLEYPTTILACLAFLVTIPIFVFYWKGPIVRERSKFAQTLASDKQAKGG